MAQSSGIASAFGELASASTKGEMAAASSKVAQGAVWQLQRQNEELKVRVSELERECDGYRERFHQADSQVRVLYERLDGLRERAAMMGRFDWLLTILLALGGIVVGVGGWPDLSAGVRLLLIPIGLLLIALPAGYKIFGGPRVGSARRQPSAEQTYHTSGFGQGSGDQSHRPQP
jgi:hypothetical protein